MTRFLLRLMSMLILICVCSALLTLVVGQMLILPDNELVFEANLRSGNSDIYRMDIAHRLIVPITKDSAVDAQPVWSPDGQQIAFDSSRNDQYSIYLMNATGSSIHPLHDDGVYDYEPSWSPDGRSIAYITTQFQVSSELMLTDLQSGTTRRLTDNRQREENAEWSPDGRHLVFSFDTNSSRFMDIFSLDLQSGDVSPLFVTSDFEHSPNWSPDGHYVFYIAWGSHPGMYLWDTTHTQSLLLYPLKKLNITNPTWSPDGRFIIYAPLTNTNQNAIYQLDVAACLEQPDDCNPQALSLPPGIYANPRWRPH